MIFLTGANGFLGRHVLNLLEGQKHQVCCLSKNPQSNTNLVKWKHFDLASSSQPEDLLKGCTQIFHVAAAIKGKPEYLAKINYLGTQILLEAAEIANVKKFIYISSIDALLFNYPYAKSKGDAEELVTNSNLNSIIIRPSVIFGSNDTKNFHSLNTIIQHMPFIPLPYYGKFKWEPVFVEDLAYYIAERGLRKNKKKEISNVVGPETLSFCEILSKMEKYRKVKRIKIPIPDFYMIILKKLLALFISKHSIEAIFSSFSDKVFHGDKVRLSTKFGDFLRATESVQI